MCTALLTLEITISTAFLLFEPLRRLYTETAKPMNKPSHCTPLHSYICCLLCFLCVLKWLPYIWKRHINSIVVCRIHLKSSRSQPTHSPTPASLSCERRQNERYNTGSFGVENGVPLIFCLVQFPYSELGWQLECLCTRHATVKPSHSPPLHTLCFAALWQKQKPLYTPVSPLNMQSKRAHAATHADIKMMQEINTNCHVQE